MWRKFPNLRAGNCNKNAALHGKTVVAQVKKLVLHHLAAPAAPHKQQDEEDEDDDENDDQLRETDGTHKYLPSGAAGV